jgi:hypothetical protein
MSAKTNERTNRVFVIWAYIDFLIATFLSNSHSKFPTISTIFFNSQLHLAIPFCLFNSLILQYLPHVTHFPKSLPLSHFPQTVPTLQPLEGTQRDGRTYTHQTKRRVSHNTSPLSVEGYTKPSAEL